MLNHIMASCSSQTYSPHIEVRFALALRKEVPQAFASSSQFTSQPQKTGNCRIFDRECKTTFLSLRIVKCPECCNQQASLLLLLSRADKLGNLKGFVAMTNIEILHFRCVSKNNHHSLLPRFFLITSRKYDVKVGSEMTTDFSPYLVFECEARMHDMSQEPDR